MFNQLNDSAFMKIAYTREIVQTVKNGSNDSLVSSEAG